MKFVFLILLPILSHSSYADLGFYSIDRTDIPVAVKDAAASVFQLRVAFASDWKSVVQFDVSNGQGQKIKEDLNAIKPTLEFDELDKIVVIKEIEQCEKLTIENQKFCTAFITNAHGTGFLARDEKTIWTNGHVIEPYLKTVAMLEKTSIRELLNSKARILVFGFDSHQKLVLDPFANEIKIQFIPEETMFAKVKGHFHSEDSDYLGLSLSQPIGKPIKIAAHVSPLGSPVFILGYPICTGCDVSTLNGIDPNDFVDRSPFPNSDGNGLQVSRGIVLDIKSLLNFFGLSEGFLGNWNLEKMMFTSADGVEGNSGSPILNANGELTAIFSGSKTRIIGGKPQVVSRAVLPPELF